MQDNGLISIPVFTESLPTARSVSIVNQWAGAKPRFVENALEAEAMRGLFQSTVELHLLQKMLAMDSLIRPFMLDSAVPKVVTCLMRQNPGH